MGLREDRERYSRVRVEKVIQHPESLEDSVKQFKKTLTLGQLPVFIRAMWQKNLFGPDDAVVYAEVVNLNGKQIPKDGQTGS